jgi:hypothetical protein
VSEYQLRIYKRGAGRMAEFIEAWRAHIVPGREEFGLKVVAAWGPVLLLVDDQH